MPSAGRAQHQPGPLSTAEEDSVARGTQAQPGALSPNPLTVYSVGPISQPVLGFQFQFCSSLFPCRSPQRGTSLPPSLEDSKPISARLL